MSSYLRNVAHRTAGASLLRPRVPSRFEPTRGMGPAMDHFREMVTERVADSPRVTQASEARLTPPPTPSRIGNTLERRAEAEAKAPAATNLAVDERAFTRTKPEIDRPHPLKELHTQNDSVSSTPTAARILQPEIPQKPADTRVLISRDLVVEKVQPRQEPIRPIVEADAPFAVPSVTSRFPAPVIERREPPNRPEQPVPPQRRSPATNAEPRIHTREFSITHAPAHVQPDISRTEIAAPSIHVTIGKVTVQATLPATPAHASARVPAHSGPRLTLERYLDRRGGRP